MQEKFFDSAQAKKSYDSSEECIHYLKQLNSSKILQNGTKRLILTAKHDYWVVRTFWWNNILKKASFQGVMATW